jgi:hypothetical protein
MGVDLSLGALVRVRHSAQDMELARARRSVREKVTARDMVPVRLLMVALVLAREKVSAEVKAFVKILKLNQPVTGNLLLRVKSV